MDFVESKLVELKETIVDDIKKEVIAFINSEGGNLYVGVADDGHVIGLDDPQSDMLRLTNMIRDTIKPDATMFVECQIEKIDTKDIVRVQVQKGTHAPYYLVGKGIRPEGVFVRQGTSSVPASEDAIRRMIKESDGDCFETMRSLNQDLSFETLTEDCSGRDIVLGAPQMVSLGIKTPDGVYTNLGLLLSDQCTHTIKTALFSGVKKEQFQDRKEFSGSILQQMNDAYAFIDLNNKKKSTFSGLHRMDQRDYPETAVREALLNSLVHREYSFSSSTLISIFSDRIEFVSLGGLVKGLTLKDIMLGISQCRNEKLAAVGCRASIGHGQNTAFVETHIGNFVLEFIAGVPRTRSQRIPGLNHEFGNDPVKFQTIIKRFVFQVFIGDEFIFPLCQCHEIGHGYGRFFIIQLHDYGTFVGLDLRIQSVGKIVVVFFAGKE